MRFSAVILMTISSMFASAALAQSPKLAVEEMMVPSSDAGIEIYVRNKRPADMTSFRPERTVLYVHGATYPASTAFDLQLDGMSWMDYIASRGYDVYLLDLRGYGKSTRPEGNERQAGSQRAAGARRDGGKGHFIRRRFHSEAAQHLEGQSARLVVGHDADGDLHDAKRREGGAPGAVCAGVDSQHAVAGAVRSRTDPGLPDGAEGPGTRAMAHRRRR